MNSCHLIFRFWSLALFVAIGLSTANAADFSWTPYARRTPVSGSNILLEGVFPPARVNSNDCVVIDVATAGFPGWDGLGEMWWSWTPSFSGEVVLTAEPDGSPVDDEGYAVGYGDYGGDPIGCYAVRARRVRASWPVSQPRRLFRTNDRREFLKHQPPFIMAHYSVTQGVASVVAAMGTPGRPYRFRLLCSAGPIIVKQPPTQRRLRVGDSLFVAALVAGPRSKLVPNPSPNPDRLNEWAPAWTSQWFKDGQPLAEATSMFFLKDKVSAMDSGKYRLWVTSATGESETTECNVAVVPEDSIPAGVQTTTHKNKPANARRRIPMPALRFPCAIVSPVPPGK